MISLKRYLDAVNSPGTEHGEDEGTALLSLALTAYRSSLHEMGICSIDVCPGAGGGLKRELEKLAGQLADARTRQLLAATEDKIRNALRAWSQTATTHNEQKTHEIKEMLIVMARAAESVGERDQRCAKQIDTVTTRLRKIATLEDLSEIRSTIEASATELRTSIDRMTAEGKAAIEELRKEVTVYQAKLEEAEKVSARDALTGLRNRMRMEIELSRHLSSGEPFCVAVLDIDGFKQVNDEHGHVVGDELLKQFADELKSVSRATDVIGRWGGDEFLIVLDGAISKASTQVERLREWVCGSYTVQGASGPCKLQVGASIGLAEHRQNESLKSLIDRADAEMYKHKASSRKGAAR